MKIRLEEEKDYFMNENLTREAFWNVYRPGCYEHYILHKIRTDKCYVKELSYVVKAHALYIVKNVLFVKNIAKIMKKEYVGT